MFTQNYLHGRKENIKLLVDIGKVVDAFDTHPDRAHDMAHEMMEKLGDWEPLYVRCLVQAYKAWYIKSDLLKTHPLDEVKVEAETPSDAKVVQVDEFGLAIAAEPVPAK
jgi:hypothetical protein